MLAITAGVLVVCGAAGSTVAWLMSRSEPLVNTFTHGSIAITLQETNVDDGDPSANSYPMDKPGAKITKDPSVTVLANSEPAYLFVTLDKSANFDSYLTFAIANGWEQLQSGLSVYWRKVDASDADQTFAVLEDDAVHVKADLTRHDLNQLAGTNALPTLTLTAYAIQQTGIDTAVAAWTAVQAAHP